MLAPLFLIVCGIWRQSCEAQNWYPSASTPNQFLNSHESDYSDYGRQYHKNPSDSDTHPILRQTSANIDPPNIYAYYPGINDPFSHTTSTAEPSWTNALGSGTRRQDDILPNSQSNALGSGTRKQDDILLNSQSSILYNKGQLEQSKSNRDSSIKSDLTDSLSEFTVNLMRSVNENNYGENLLFSPISIYTALALIHMGSSGVTNEELTNVMKLPKNLVRTPQILHKNLGEIFNSTKLSGISSGGRKISQLEIANGLFIQKKFPIRDSYKNDAESYYDGQIRNLEFASSTAYEEINRWVAKKTSNRISKLFTKPLNRNTVSVLISALYFNGGWLDAFRERFTKPETFKTAAETEVQIPMMNRQGAIFYTKNNDRQFEAVQLDFYGYVYSAVFVLPDRSQSLTNLIANLDANTLRSLLNITTQSGVDLKIPKFSFSKSKSLNDVLRSLGVSSMFDKAELNNLVNDNDTKVRISDVKHAADITIDELGMKATAVTSVQVELLSARHVPKEPIKFYLDRPFIAMIVHRPTSIVLFAAAVNDPTRSVYGPL